MGQKTLPISLRLNKNKNWHSNWMINKNDYSELLHFDLEIRQYFENIFNNQQFKLMKLNIIKTSKNINIYLYLQGPSMKKKNHLFYHQIINHLNFYYSQHNIKLFIKRIQIKNLKNFFKKIKKIFYFIKKRNRINIKTRSFIYIFSYALFTKQIHLISFLIQQLLEKKKSHKKQIKVIYQFFKSFFKLFKNFLGYRLQYKGRINGSKRKKKFVYQEGKIPLNTLNLDIKYAFNEFKTPSGICSIKLWVFIKKKNVIS